MFQTFDTNSPASRQAWMALLSRAPKKFLNDALTGQSLAQIHWLRRPETGLMMVQGRVGGTGQRFNLGEITVTRCALRLNELDSDAPVGVAYLLGRDHHHAQLAAVADALLQDPLHHPLLEKKLLCPLREYLQTQKTERHDRAQTTKVDFMTVAREVTVEGNGDEA